MNEQNLGEYVINILNTYQKVPECNFIRYSDGCIDDYITTGYLLEHPDEFIELGNCYWYASDYKAYLRAHTDGLEIFTPERMKFDLEMYKKFIANTEKTFKN